MSYNELKQHGTVDFPFQLYRIDKFHPKYEMAFHWHKQAEIVKINSGKLNISLNNKKYAAVDGDIIFVNSEFVHGAAPENCEYECLVFDMEFMTLNNRICRNFISDIVNHTVFVKELFNKKDNPEIFDTVNELFTEMQSYGDGKYFQVLGLTYKLFGYIKGNNYYTDILPVSSSQNEKNFITLKKVLNFMRTKYDSKITLEEIAAVAKMSTKYFCAFFKEMTNKTPFEYLKFYRIERSARQLLNSDISVTQIAYSCGFNDLSYFIKTFKEIKGVSPKIFRKDPSAVKLQ